MNHFVDLGNQQTDISKINHPSRLPPISHNASGDASPLPIRSDILDDRGQNSGRMKRKKHRQTKQNGNDDISNAQYNSTKYDKEPVRDQADKNTSDTKSLELSSTSHGIVNGSTDLAESGISNHSNSTDTEKHNTLSQPEVGIESKSSEVSSRPTISLEPHVIIESPQGQISSGFLDTSPAIRPKNITQPEPSSYTKADEVEEIHVDQQLNSSINSDTSMAAMFQIGSRPTSAKSANSRSSSKPSVRIDDEVTIATLPKNHNTPVTVKKQKHKKRPASARSTSSTRSKTSQQEQKAATGVSTVSSSYAMQNGQQHSFRFRRTTQRTISSHLYSSIFTILLCGLIPGLVALYFSIKTRRALKEGEYFYYHYCDARVLELLNYFWSWSTTGFARDSLVFAVDR